MPIASWIDGISVIAHSYRGLELKVQENLQFLIIISNFWVWIKADEEHDSRPIVRKQTEKMCLDIYFMDHII